MKMKTRRKKCALATTTSTEVKNEEDKDEVHERQREEEETSPSTVKMPSSKRLQRDGDILQKDGIEKSSDCQRPAKQAPISLIPAAQTPKKSCEFLFNLMSNDEKCEIIQDLSRLLNDDELLAVATSLLYSCLITKDEELVKFVPVDFVKCLVNALEYLKTGGFGNVVYLFLQGLLDGEENIMTCSVKDLIANGQERVKAKAKQDSERMENAKQVAENLEKFVETINVPDSKVSSSEDSQMKKRMSKYLEMDADEIGHNSTVSEQVENEAGSQEFVLSLQNSIETVEVLDTSDVDLKESILDEVVVSLDDAKIQLVSLDEDTDSQDEVSDHPDIKTEEKNDYEEIKYFKAEKKKNNVHVSRDLWDKMGKENYNCRSCRQIFPIDSVMEHQASHASEMFYCKVESCSKMYYDQDQLDQHMADKHTEQSCDVCGEKFKNILALSKHQRTVHKMKPSKKPMKCSHCGLACASYSALSKHVAAVHEKKTLYNCTVCEKGFNSQTLLKNHVLNIHKGVKPYICELCGKGFTTNQSLKEHVNIHKGLKPYKCDVCPESFARFTSLKRHKFVNHTEKSNVCTICNRTYLDPYTLNAHMKSDHDRLTPKMRTPKPNVSCHICGKKMKRPYELKKHIEIVHEKRKDYECDICHKKFALKAHLMEHYPVHDRKARFHCQYCGEGFLHRVSYKVHVYRHENEPANLKCPLCSKKFDVPSYLQRHIKLVHKGIKVEIPDIKMPSSSLPEDLKQPPGKKGRDKPKSSDTAKIAVEKRRGVDFVERQEETQEVTYIPQNELEGTTLVYEVIEGGVGGGEVNATGENYVAEEVVQQVVEEGTRTVEIEVNGERQIMYVPAGVDTIQINDQLISLADFM